MGSGIRRFHNTSCILCRNVRAGRRRVEREKLPSFGTGCPTATMSSRISLRVTLAQSSAANSLWEDRRVSKTNWVSGINRESVRSSSMMKILAPPFSPPGSIGKRSTKMVRKLFVRVAGMKKLCIVWISLARPSSGRRLATLILLRSAPKLAIIVKH